MAFELPKLPYSDDALHPVITAQTISFHYGKHHKAYVDNINNLIKSTEWENASLEKIMLDTAGKTDKAGFFNNAAQVWNHTFYWNCLKPNGGGQPQGKLADMINKTWGDYETFKKEFVNACMTQFGSGWAWLVEDTGQLKIVKTGNAECPLTKGQKPLLTIDVWEHAYYLDFQNRRLDYANALMDKLVNWDFVTKNLG